MPKGTFQTEATSNSEKFKLVALAVVELCLAEGISQPVGWPVNRSVGQLVGQLDQSVGWSVSQKVPKKILNSMATF